MCCVPSLFSFDPQLLSLSPLSVFFPQSAQLRRRFYTGPPKENAGEPPPGLGWVFTLCFRPLGFDTQNWKRDFQRKVREPFSRAKSTALRGYYRPFPPQDAFSTLGRVGRWARKEGIDLKRANDRYREKFGGSDRDRPIDRPTTTTREAEREKARFRPRPTTRAQRKQGTTPNANRRIPPFCY